MLFRQYSLTYMLVATATFLLDLSQAFKLPEVDSGTSSSHATAFVTKMPLLSINKPNEKNPLSKRDLSLSYTATDIDSKEGARIKTITVIKNHNKDMKNEKFSINPDLHNNENWADAFRDNFDQFGKIPDVPDIDDLFEFMDKKSKMQPTKSKDKEEPVIRPKPTTTTTTVMHPRQQPPTPAVRHNNDSKAMQHAHSAAEKPVVESTVDMPTETSLHQPDTMAMMQQHKKKIESTDRSAPTVEKIKGDAELVPFLKGGNKHEQHMNSKKNNSKSQSQSPNQSDERSNEANLRPVSESLSSNKERLRESLVNVNYSTPKHSVHQYFENYVQQIPTANNFQTGIQQPVVPGYDYPRPCANQPTGSVSVSTPSGRTYDVPSAGNAVSVNNGIINPYIAPSVFKRPTQQQGTASPPQQSQNPQAIANNNSNQPFPPYTNPNQSQQPVPTPAYSVNSIVPPLQPNSAQQPAQRTILTNNQKNIQQMPQQPQPGGVSGYFANQQPYVAPSLRNGLGLSRGPPSTPATYEGPTGAPNFRINSYGIGSRGGLNKLNYGRSRGLKY